MALILASLLLSVASFYTTWVGITPFVQYTIFAAFITVGIQSLLLVTSWRIGFMFAGKEPLSVVEILVFMVCLTLSVFFSFNSLFNVIFIAERQQEASLTRVRDGSSAAVTRVEQVLKGRRDEYVAALRQSEEYRRWRSDLRAIADLAGDNAAGLRGMLESQRAERAQEAARLETDARDLAASKGTIEGEITSAELHLARLQTGLPSQSEDLGRLGGQLRLFEDEVLQKLADMRAEEGGIGETGVAGQGPKWKALKKDHDVALSKKQLVEQQVALARTRLAESEQTIKSLSEEIRKKKLLFDNIDAEITAAAERAQDARERLADFGTDGGPETGIQVLRDYPDRFEVSADVSFLERAELICSQIYDNLRALSPTPVGLLGHSCDRAAIMAKIAPITVATAALAELDQRCTGITAPSFHELTLAAALAAARACIDVSGLPYREVRAEREELDRLQREEGPNASEFTKTTNALFAGEKLAIFALVIALVMDLLVLFTGLVGAKSATARVATGVRPIFPGDSEDVIAIKTLLNRVEPYEGRLAGVRYEGRIDIGLIPDPKHRELLEPMLVRNTVVGMARRSTKDGERAVYYLRHGAHEQFEEELEKAVAHSAQEQVLRQRPGPARQTWHQPPSGRPVAGLGAPRPYGPGERQNPFRQTASTTRDSSATSRPEDGAHRTASARALSETDPKLDHRDRSPLFHGEDAPAIRTLATQPERSPEPELSADDALIQEMLGISAGNGRNQRTRDADAPAADRTADPSRHHVVKEVDGTLDEKRATETSAQDDYDWLLGVSRRQDDKDRD